MTGRRHYGMHICRQFFLYCIHAEKRRRKRFCWLFARRAPRQRLSVGPGAWSLPKCPSPFISFLRRLSRRFYDDSFQEMNMIFGEK